MWGGQHPPPVGPVRDRTVDLRLRGNIQTFPKTYPPHHITLAPTQGFADIVYVEFLQRGEIQLVYPRLGHKTTQKIFYHVRFGEQQFIGGVVGHAASIIA